MLTSPLPLWRPYRAFPYIIWWAVAVHILWGLALIVDPTLAVFVILIGMQGVVTVTGISGAPLGVVLLLAAAVAGASLLLTARLTNRVALALLMPQYLLVMMAILSDLIAIVTGEAGGQPYAPVLLLAVLCPVIVAGALHSVAIIERHLTWTR